MAVTRAGLTFDHLSEHAVDDRIAKRSPRGRKYLVEINAGGVALLDYDRDGDLDLFITHWGNDVPPGPTQHLWRNNGNGTFTDVSAASGIAATYTLPNGTISDLSFTPNFALAQASTVWYADIVLIVLGHVIAVFLSHLRAGERFRSRRGCPSISEIRRSIFPSLSRSPAQSARPAMARGRPFPTEGSSANRPPPWFRNT